MIVQNPGRLIFQRRLGFLFDSQPTFDPLFSRVIIFIIGSFLGMMKFRRQTRFFRFGLRCSLLNSCLLLLFSKIKLLLLLTLSDPYRAEQRRAGRLDLPAILNGQVIDKGIRIAGIVRKHIPVARQCQFRL